MSLNPMLFVEHSSEGYLLFESKTSRILDGNNLAKSFYMKSESFPTLEQLFIFDDKTLSTGKMQEDLRDSQVRYVWDLVSVKNTGEKFLCDLEIRPADPAADLFFLIIKTKVDEQVLAMKKWVDYSSKPILILTFDGSLNVGYANPKFYDFCGISEEDFRTIHRFSFASLLSDESRQDFIDSCVALEQGGTEFDMDVVFQRFKGDDSLFRIIAQKIFISGETPTVYIEIIDIKKRRELSEKLEIQTAYLNAMQDLSEDTVFHIDLKTKKFRHDAPRVTKLGLSKEILEYDKTLLAEGMVHPDDIQDYWNYTKMLMAGKGNEFRIRAAVAPGVYEWFHIKSTFIYDKKGKAVEVFGKMTNIQTEMELKRQIRKEKAEEILNKVAFEDVVSTVLKMSVRGQKHAFLFVDLDDYKKLKSAFGETFGESVLDTVGKRLNHDTRANDFVGKVSEDEFVVFFQSIETEESVLQRANLLLHTIGKEYGFQGRKTTITGSIGIAFYPENGTTFVDLYHNSDHALQNSKKSGKNSVTLYGNVKNK